MSMTIIITCEHAGNQVPDQYLKCFLGNEEILQTHKGWDPSALDIAENLAQLLLAPLAYYPITRLLIEPNRSLHHHELFSDFTRLLSKSEKQILINSLYLPYRSPVETFIQKSPKPVLHLSIHSFTPVWNGAERNVDIGLLFDPSRTQETFFCSRVKETLEKSNPELLTRLNEPYQGIDDGFTTYLRTRFSDAEYLGIELEVNQKFASRTSYISNTLYHSIIQQ